MNNIQPGNCSVPSPLDSVVNTTLYYYDLVNELPPIRSLVGCRDNSEMTLHPGVRAVIQLVLLNHMRISECLDICARDEIKPSMFLIRAKKRGVNYSVYIPISARNRTVISGCYPGQRLFPFDYHYIWRSMVRAGMSLRVSTRVNRVVTHRGRFDLATKLLQLNERSNITPLLHHKSKKTKEYYLPGAPK